MHFGGVAHTLDDVRLLGSLGLDCAELRLSAKGPLRAQLQKLRDAAQDLHLSYLVHGPLESAPTDQSYVEKKLFPELLELLSPCRALSSPLITVHCSMDRRFIPERLYHRKRELLWALAHKASRLGVQVCLETIGERAEDLAPLLAGCPELDLTMDIGHAQLFTTTNRSLKYLELWPERIRHVHAHDNRGGDSLQQDLHLPIGEGIIDFAAIFRALLKAGYDDTVTLEVPHQHLRASMQTLRQLIDAASSTPT
jgi:sugar phosphate isomerase/epimerase